MATDNKTPSLLWFDLEISPLTITSWGTYETNALEIVKEQYILSIAWKWRGEDEVHVLALPDFPETYECDPTDDSALVEAMHELFGMADIVCGHNLQKFDRRKANARFLKAGLPPPRPYTVIDTLSLARKYFDLPSNKLASLGEYLGLGGKVEHEGYGLWKKVMSGDTDAWARMKEYNARDVELLEAVYQKLKGWHEQHPSMVTISDKFGFNDEDTPYLCPSCGSDNVHREGARRTRSFLYRRIRCVDCGSWSVGARMKIKLETVEEESDVSTD